VARIKEPERRAAPLLSVLPTAPPEGQAVLLAVLPRTGASSALEAIRSSVKSDSPTVREAALRAMADWPDAAPAEDLLAQVHSAAEPNLKVIALRGYIRMAGLAKDPAAMYARALQVAERPEDKKLVLSGLGSAQPEQAINLIEPYLENPQLCNEAAQAAVQIANRLREKDAARAKALVQSALAVCTEAPIRQQGQEVINQIEQYEGYITDWVIAGPFQEKNKTAHAIFDVQFPPEEPSAKYDKWARLEKGIGKWEINLADALGGAEDVAAYVRTSVWSPAARQARLELGSDDGIKAWLNDGIVHANNTERGLSPRQDLVKVNLKEGWNNLVLKVTNRAGPWAFCCRFRQPDGRAVNGLKVEAKP